MDKNNLHKENFANRFFPWFAVCACNKTKMYNYADTFAPMMLIEYFICENVLKSMLFTITCCVNLKNISAEISTKKKKEKLIILRWLNMVIIIIIIQIIIIIIIIIITGTDYNRAKLALTLYVR